MNLLPNNSSLTDQEFALLIDEIVKDDYSVLQIDPFTCDVRLLPHLALSESVDISGLEEKEARVYIHNAKEIKKYAGTVYAVEQTINVCFENGKLKEWFEADLEAGYFDVEVTLKADPSVVYLPTKFDKAKKMIHSSKNVRSHLNSFVIDFPKGAGNIEKNEAMNFNLALDSKESFKDIDTPFSATTGVEFSFQTDTKHNFNSPAVCTNNLIGGAVWQI